MNLMDRFLNMIGFEEEGEGAEVTPQPPAEERKRRAPLVSLPGAGGRAMHVVVVEPMSFDESRAIADQIKGRRPVILNLEGMDKEVAQKILNFLSGAVYALDGKMERIGVGIFLVAPPNIEVEMDERPQLVAKDPNFFGG